MTMQDSANHAGAGLADVNARFAALMAELDWLSAQSAHLASIGLRELRRNVSTCTFEGDGFDIDISATASAGGATVILEDSGPDARVVSPESLGRSEDRLRVLGQTFDEVTYSRTLGRNQWILRRFAPQSVGPVLVTASA